MTSHSTSMCSHRISRWACVALVTSVPSEMIEVVPGPVVGTHDEAVCLRRWLREHGLRSILVVTSAFITGSTIDRGSMR